MSQVRNIVVLTALALSGLPSFVSAKAPLQKAASQASIQPLLTKGQAALAAGRYAETLKQGKALVAKFPKRYEGHRLVARASFYLDRPDQAETAYRQALKLAPVAARPSLQGELKEVGALRQALRETNRAQSLKSAGDLANAAQAEENAYRALPVRFTYGLAAAEWFESAGMLDDARKLLEEIRDRNRTASAATHVQERLASLQIRIESARKLAAAELAKKEAEERKAVEARQIEEERRIAEKERQAREEARLAKEAEEKRLAAEREAARLAEEERQKAEKARLDREETDRLTNILYSQRSVVSSAESELRTARSAVDDAERDVSQADRAADAARSRRDQAKSKRDDLQDKYNSANELGRQVLRGELRSAESDYDDAKSDYNRAKSRLDDAQSRLSQARSNVDSARQKLDRAEQDVRDTEAAIARIGS